MSRFLTPEQLRGSERTGRQAGDLMLIVAGPARTVNASLGRPAARDGGAALELADPNAFSFLFVLDFPLLEWDDEEQGGTRTHHLFTSPRARTSP